MQKIHVTVCNAGGVSDIWDSDRTFYDDVLEFDAEEEVWKKNSIKMSIKRQAHAVSVINFEAIKDYCN